MQRPTSTHYLGGEGKRNRDHAALFTALLTRAWGECEVIVGHHVAFEFAGDLNTEDEIPSADCLLFDHGIMTAVFGEQAIPLMQRIAALKPGEREVEVQRALDALDAAAAA